jgi:hypothetical protein
MKVDLLENLNNTLANLSPLGVGNLLATNPTIQTKKEDEESSKWDEQIQKELDSLFSCSRF